MFTKEEAEAKVEQFLKALRHEGWFLFGNSEGGLDLEECPPAEEVKE
jgi:hypothetical protein